MLSFQVSVSRIFLLSNSYLLCCCSGLPSYDLYVHIRVHNSRDGPTRYVLLLCCRKCNFAITVSTGCSNDVDPGIVFLVDPLKIHDCLGLETVQRIAPSLRQGNIRNDKGICHEVSCFARGRFT